jgi:hypothetical protein
MDVPTCDLEDLWQAVRCRFRRRGGLRNRIYWVFYRGFYRLVRTVLLAGARGN